MYEYLKRLYNAGKLTEEGLENAVKKGWITEGQKAEIIAGGGGHHGVVSID